jgi:hypothetical protein
LTFIIATTFILVFLCSWRHLIARFQLLDDYELSLLLALFIEAMFLLLVLLLQSNTCKPIIKIIGIAASILVFSYVVILPLFAKAALSVRWLVNKCRERFGLDDDEMPSDKIENNNDVSNDKEILFEDFYCTFSHIYW